MTTKNVRKKFAKRYSKTKADLIQHTKMERIHIHICNFRNDIRSITK